MGEQVTLFDPDLWSGKMSPVPLVQTEERTSKPSSKKSSASQSRRLPTFHYLPRGSGRWQTPTMEMGCLLPTEFSMHSFGESPSVVVESRLSQILEVMPHPKYSLSAKACQGILRRAERRGKKLPWILDLALKLQSHSGSGQDVRGGGKGPLLQIEKSGTLGCSNDQTIFCIEPVCMATGQAGTEITEGISPTLNCNHEQPIICLCDQGGDRMDVLKDQTTLSAERHDATVIYAQIVPLDEAVSFDLAQVTSKTNASKGSTEVAYSLAATGQPVIVLNLLVRRLTPMECERLQGYPDGWTDIGAWVDSNGKSHPESSDSSRYKALGNSIAIPPWRWVLKRLCSHYEREATMASLFDGIGGFPLIWEQLNGKGTCLWASEIEEFPMAVTKYHFQ